ncbi:MAG: DUF3160 domain-containing protein [Treponema sp.]|nr:DUF3160 domain-containing protein [Treponema sp.]
MKKSLLFVVVALILVSGCKSKNKVTVKQTPQYQGKVKLNTDSLKIPGVSSNIREKLDFSFYDCLNLENNGKPVNTAHKMYLNDKMEFTDLAYDDTLYLVASNKCELYSEDCFVLNKDGLTYSLVSDDIKGESIPIGTLLKADPKASKIIGPNDEKIDNYSGLIYFQDNYNYFYKVQYGDKSGYVFGADLHNSNYQIVENSMKNALYSKLLLNNGFLNEFYPYEGDTEIQREDILKSLNEYKIAFSHYEPSILECDDLIDSYRQQDKMTPLFITTDLVSHAQHKVFDSLLQRIEEQFFIPRIRDLTGLYIKTLEQQTDVPPDVKKRAVNYFKVAELILRLAPQPDKNGEYHKIKEYDQILKEYPSEVISDFYQIEKASGEKSMLFESVEQFNQYEPRGHYTKTPALESYFKASMWFGRINFIIDYDEINEITNEEMRKMMPVALFIIDTVKKNPQLYSEWEEVFNPITALIGDSDDLSFNDILPLWEEQKVDDFTGWVSDENNLIIFIKLCHEKLRNPEISGNTVIYGPSEVSEDEEGHPVLTQPMGWKFLGQRFTYDSLIHHKASAPRIKGRTLVRGLDVMKAFGSKSADKLLSLNDYKNFVWPPTCQDDKYKGGQELVSALNELEKSFNEFDSSFWTKNYYNTVLSQVRSQTSFEQGAGFYFTETPLWNVKALISSHSTWAELRHDTILYVKQSYGEMGSGGELSPTFRTLPIPLPINCIEPNLKFWETGCDSLKKLESTLKQYNLLDDEGKESFNCLLIIYSKAVEIVKKEVQDRPITKEENNWIKTIPGLLKSAVLPGYSLYVQNKDDLKMACIADIFTDHDTQTCVEVGIGGVIKMNVVLNDGCGGKRIAVGFIPEYCEFLQSAENRLTDEQWKSIYDYSYEPFWEVKCILPEF